MNNHRGQGGEIPIFVRVLLILVVCVIFGVIIIYTNNRDQQESERLKQIEEESKAEKESKEAQEEAFKQVQSDRFSFTLSGDSVSEEDDSLISVYDVLADEYEGEIVVDSETFAESASLVSGFTASQASISMSVSCSLAEADVAVLQFKAQTESGGGWLDVSCGDSEASVWVSETATTFYVPICGECNISKIYLKMDTSGFVKTNIDEVYLVKYEDTSVTSLMVGAYSDYECDTTVIEAEAFELEVDATVCFSNNGYLFALSEGTLGVYQILDSGYELVSEYSGMGETEDMAFTDDKNAIIVTAGINGAYILDVSDPNNVYMASHYATLESSSGVYVSENYAFICNRYFGLEIVDISDISNPTYVNQVGASVEYKDCYVSEGYLYVGVYSQKRIDIYDITDLNNPSMVSRLALDGNGQGLFVSDGILYVATGMDSDDTENSSTDLSDYGKGTGNGMEIIDVSDPANPSKLTIVKTPGRLSYDENDVWNVVVSGNYAYLSSRYSGLYVYDVSDPEKPVCVDIYQIEAENGSSLYESVDSETYAFPYDTESVSRGCICNVYLQDGYLYASAANMGVYRIEEDYIAEVSQAEEFKYTFGEVSSSVPEIEGCNVEQYVTGTSIYAVASYDGYYYVACGDGGIDILDGNLTLVANYPTDYAVLDIKVAGGCLFTAESRGGIGIWTVSGSTLERISTYRPYDGCYSSVTTTDDGNYLIAQCSTDTYVLVNATDKYNPVSAGDANTGIGSMCYRNLYTKTTGNYLCVYGSELQCWYYYDGTSFSYVAGVDNSLYTEYGGMCAVGDKVVYIKTGGYYYFDPALDTVSERIMADDAMLKGKCFSSGDILVVLDEYSGNVIVLNVEDIDNPYYIAQFTTEGNPDIGIIDGNYLLIPCRNNGLLRIDISGLE